MNTNMQLVKLVSGMEPVDFVGLARLLGVSVLQPINKDGVEFTSTSTAPDPQKNMEPRAFLDVLEDVIKKFDSLNRSKKRELLRIIKKSNSIHTKKESGKDAGTAEDS